MSFERRQAYSAVWIVLSLPRPLAALERGKMVDEESSGITFILLFLHSSFSTAPSSRSHPHTLKRDSDDSLNY